MPASDRPDSAPTVIPPRVLTPDVSRTIDNVIVAASQMQHWLKPSDPPLGAI